MRVTVTGGAGYIGSVVTEMLLRGGHDVLVVDNLIKGHRYALSEGAAFAELDLMDRKAVASRLNTFGAEAVIHMAAYSLVGESVIDPARYYANNLTAGFSLLDAMRDVQVARLVFSSTAAVYGEPAKQPIDEGDPTDPTNPYGETKLAFERVLRWYANAYGIRSISLRYFNAAGATVQNGEDHDPETHLIPLVLQAAVGRLPHVTIFGTDYPTPDGTCVRDYVHVEDLATAHILALGALAEPGVCRAYNVGCGGDGYSVREVIDTAQLVVGRSIPVKTAARRPGDPAVLIASAERLKKDLGWSPRHQQLKTIISSAWNHMSRTKSHGV
jgi:UDP-glucose 4-epimerase